MVKRVYTPKGVYIPLVDHKPARECGFVVKTWSNVVKTNAIQLILLDLFLDHRNTRHMRATRNISNLAMLCGTVVIILIYRPLLQVW